MKHNFLEGLSEIQKTISVQGLRGLSCLACFDHHKKVSSTKTVKCFYNIGNSKKMERMIDKFLWKGPGKVTRLSDINSLQNGGLNLTVLET